MGAGGTLALALLFASLGLVPAAGAQRESALPPRAPATDLHLVPSELVNELDDDATLLHRYGARVLVSTEEVEELAPRLSSRLRRLEDAGAVHYRSWEGEVEPPATRRLSRGREGYYLLALAGPPDPDWLTELQELGLEVVDRARPYALVVRARGAALLAAAKLTTSAGFGVVRGTLALPEDARLAPSLRDLLAGRVDAVTAGLRTDSQGRGVVLVEVFSDRSRSEVLDRVASLVERAPPGLSDRRGNAFLIRGPDLRTILRREPAVAYIEPVLERQLYNNLAADSGIINVEPIWSALGYNGAGVIVGINDGGVDLSHPDFQDVAPGDAFVATSGAMSGTDNFHGTHVSGSVLGRGNASPSPTNTFGCGDVTPPLPTVRGMAWGALGTHNNIFDGGITTEPGMMEWSYLQGARINTNSWGYCAPCFPACTCGSETSYTTNTRDVDLLVRDADSTSGGNQELLIVFAAGNDGPGGATIGAPGNGKNSLTVGASQNNRCGSYIGSGPDIDALAAFSSRGPAQQRIKPDVVAPGTDVLSVESSDPLGDNGGWDQGWTGPDYAILPGTSMATPLTAGCSALFHEFYDATFGPATPSPALAKAALINGAVDMGFGYPSLDQGWGRIDCRQSIEGPPGGRIELIEQEPATALSTGESFQESLACQPGSPRLKVTLVWTDPAAGAGCDPCDANDLDLVVTDPLGDVYRGNQFTPGTGWSQANPGPVADGLNNVENVFVPAPAAGGWTIEVEGTSVTTSPPGLSGQDFALVYSGDCGPCVPPLEPSGLSATPNGINRIDLSWTASATPGVTDYTVYRATSSGGPYSQIGTVSGGATTYSDTTASGGVTYYYVVRADQGCESGDSNEASATASGVCTEPPAFAGVTSVSALSGGGSCGLRVRWPAATGSCEGGLTYSVWRATGGAPDPDTDAPLATCVPNTFFDDITAALDTEYFYVVRAEDATSNGAGPCNGGNLDTNTVSVSGTESTLGPTVLYSNDFESCSGLCDWNLGTFGGGPNDWQGVQTCTANSGTEIFRFGGDTGLICTANYSNNNNAVAWPDPEPGLNAGLVIPAGATNVRLHFFHRYAFENNWDGGRLRLAADSFPTFTVIPGTHLSGHNYTGNLLSDGLPAFSGSSGGFVETWVDLDAMCNDINGSPCAGQTLHVGFNGRTDVTITADGWFLDDVEITADVPGVGGCSAPPANPSFLTATATTGQVELEWLTPPTCDAGDTVVIRSSTTAFPVDPADGSPVGAPIACPTIATHQTLIDGPLPNDAAVYYTAFVRDSATDTYASGKVVAARPFDTAAGPTKWAYSTGASALSPPTVGSVYGASNDRVFHSVDPGGGGGTWPSGWLPLGLNGPAQGRQPVVPVAVGPATKVAFVGSWDGSVYAIDADTGQQLWASPDLGMVQAPPAGIFTAFTGDYDLLMVGTRNAGAPNLFYALNLADGTVAWSFDNGGGASGMGIISGAASIDYATNRVCFAGRALTGGSGDTIRCLAFTDTGAAQLWAEDVGDTDGSPIFANGKVYVGTNDSKVYALDLANGNVLWSFDAGDGPVKGYVWPRFGTNELFFATTNTLWSISDDGASASENWQVGSIPTPSIPLLRPGRPELWVGGGDGNLYRLDLGAGPPALTPTTLGDGTAAIGSPAWDFANAMLYVGSEDGKIYALAPPP